MNEYTLYTITTPQKIIYSRFISSNCRPRHKVSTLWESGKKIFVLKCSPIATVRTCVLCTSVLYRYVFAATHTLRPYRNHTWLTTIALLSLALGIFMSRVHTTHWFRIEFSFVLRLVTMATTTSLCPLHLWIQSSKKVHTNRLWNDNKRAFAALFSLKLSQSSWVLTIFLRFFFLVLVASVLWVAALCCQNTSCAFYLFACIEAEKFVFLLTLDVTTRSVRKIELDDGRELKNAR